MAEMGGFSQAKEKQGVRNKAALKETRRFINKPES
jgi:hypothetical protein